MPGGKLLDVVVPVVPCTFPDLMAGGAVLEAMAVPDGFAAGSTVVGVPKGLSL